MTVEPTGWGHPKTGFAVAILALVTLQWVSYFIPPLQAPDEIAHIVRFASITEGEWLPRTPERASTGGHFDEALASLVRSYEPLIHTEPRTVAPADQDAARNQPWLRSLAFGEAPGSAVYPPLIYLPAAAGLTLGRALGLTVYQSYQLARLSSHLACAVLLALAVIIWPLPLAVWAVLLLPMSVFQMAAPVIDGPSHALTVLALALFARLCEQPRLLLGAVWCGVLTILVTARLHLMPLLALPLWVAWRHRKPVWISFSAVAVLITIAWVLWTVSHVVDTRIPREVRTLDIAQHYLLHPAEVGNIWLETLDDEGRQKFYFESFIGKLGALNVRLPEPAYAQLAGLLVLSIVTGLLTLRSKAPSVAPRLVLLWAAGASICLTFLLLLVSWTPFPTRIVEGVQGRYFISPAIVVVFALCAVMSRQRLAPRTTALKSLPWAVLFVFGALSLSSLWETLLLRYPLWARGAVWN